MADETKEYEPDELAPGTKAGPPLTKQCSKCKKTKETSCFHKRSSRKDGLQTQCKLCFSERDKKRREKSKKNRLEETDLPEGHKRCAHAFCNKVFPLSHFQSTHSRRTKLTAKCKKCRAIQKKSEENPTTAIGKCKAWWINWKQTNPCVMCEEEGENCVYPRDWRLIQADHIEPKAERKKRTGEEGHRLGDYTWWACPENDGVEGMEEEAKKCQALCIFHHRTKSKEERKEQTQRHYIEKRKIINEKKRERGECLKCKRACVKGIEYLFDLDHRDEPNKTITVSNLVYKSWSYFDEELPLELAKCDLLCCGCHAIKTYY
jgi:hypothetical protein